MSFTAFFEYFIENFYTPAIQIFNGLPVSLRNGIIAIVSMTFVCLCVKTIRRLS